MKNSKYSKAKVMTLIPLIVFVVTVICMITATILEVPTSRGSLYSVIILIGVMSMFLSPLPCLVLSIIGTVFAAKALKEGNTQTKKFLILGILEIIACLVGVILAILMFIGGQSV